jgi:hypothetical protein
VRTSARGSVRWEAVAFQGSPLVKLADFAAFPTVLNKEAMALTDRADLSCWAPSWRDERAARARGVGVGVTAGAHRRRLQMMGNFSTQQVPGPDGRNTHL